MVLLVYDFKLFNNNLFLLILNACRTCKLMAEVIYIYFYRVWARCVRTVVMRRVDGRAWRAAVHARRTSAFPCVPIICVTCANLSAAQSRELPSGAFATVFASVFMFLIK